MSWGVSPGVYPVWDSLGFLDLSDYFPLFRILYQVDSLSLPLLFGLVGIYLVPLPAGYFSAFSSVHIAGFGVVFLYSDSLWFLYCGGFSLWVGLYGWLVKVSWLGKLVSVFWWGELDSFSLECNEVSSNEF